MFSCTPQCSKQLPLQKILQIGEVLGHHVDAKISPKVASERAQTTVSENRYTPPNIDVFLDSHYNASSANRKQCAGIIFGTPGTVYLRYSLVVLPNVLRSFPSVFERPSIPVVR